MTVLIVIAHARAGAVQGHLDARFRDVERLGGFSRRVIEHVAQQEHRARRRRERFKREQESERYAFKHLVARRRFVVRSGRAAHTKRGYLLRP